MRAQAQRMQGSLPVGNEGAMPPTAQGALQQRMQQMMQERQMQQMMQGLQGAQQGMQQAPPEVSTMPVDPNATFEPKTLPPQAAAPAQANMMDQQSRMQEIMKRLQMAQQAQGGMPQQGMM